MKKPITAERVRELLDYDRSTGIFTWRISKNNNGALVGDVAGSPNAHGHIQIGLDGGNFYAHRLAWLYVIGEFPAFEIDHKDLNPQNNAFDNLRQAVNGQNHWNRKAPSTNKSGFKGVCFHKKTGNWRATIVHQGKQHHIGFFKEAIEAARARDAKAVELQGEFAWRNLP